MLVILGLSAAYVVAEVIGGLYSGSLALLADAGHTLSDVGALALSLVALWIARHPATTRRTFGHTRAEILAALAQGVALVVVSVFIVFEAIERLSDPGIVNAPIMIGVASGGLTVNAIGLWLLRRGQAENLNVRGAWLHIASDALGSLGVIVAGLCIAFFGWMWVDPLASIAISILILFAAWYLLREGVDVLMEAAPAHLDVNEIRAALLGQPGAEAVHDLHVWTIGSGEVSLSCHVVAGSDIDSGDLLARLQSLLVARFEIGHTTLQIEPASGSDAECATSCEEPIAAKSA